MNAPDPKLVEMMAEIQRETDCWGVEVGVPGKTEFDKVCFAASRKNGAVVRISMPYLGDNEHVVSSHPENYWIVNTTPKKPSQVASTPDKSAEIALQDKLKSTQAEVAELKAKLARIEMEAKA